MSEVTLVPEVTLEQYGAPRSRCLQLQRASMDIVLNTTLENRDVEVLVDKAFGQKGGVLASLLQSDEEDHTKAIDGIVSFCYSHLSVWSFVHHLAAKPIFNDPQVALKSLNLFYNVLRKLNKTLIADAYNALPLLEEIEYNYHDPRSVIERKTCNIERVIAPFANVIINKLQLHRLHEQFDGNFSLQTYLSAPASPTSGVIESRAESRANSFELPDNSTSGNSNNRGSANGNGTGNNGSVRGDVSGSDVESGDDMVSPGPQERTSLGSGGPSGSPVMTSANNTGSPRSNRNRTPTVSQDSLSDPKIQKVIEALASASTMNRLMDNIELITRAHKMITLADMVEERTQAEKERERALRDSLIALAREAYGTHCALVFFMSHIDEKPRAKLRSRFEACHRAVYSLGNKIHRLRQEVGVVVPKDLDLISDPVPPDFGPDCLVRMLPAYAHRPAPELKRKRALSFLPGSLTQSLTPPSLMPESPAPTITDFTADTLDLPLKDQDKPSSAWEKFKMQVSNLVSSRGADDNSSPLSVAANEENGADDDDETHSDSESDSNPGSGAVTPISSASNLNLPLYPSSTTASSDATGASPSPLSSASLSAGDNSNNGVFSENRIRSSSLSKVPEDEPVPNNAVDNSNSNSEDPSGPRSSFSLSRRTDDAQN